MQSKSPHVHVKEPYGNLDMVTSKLSSCNPECTKYIPAYNVHYVERQYRDRDIDPDKEICLSTIFIIFLPINLNMCFGCSKEQSH